MSAESVTSVRIVGLSPEARPAVKAQKVEPFVPKGRMSAGAGEDGKIEDRMKSSLGATDDRGFSQGDSGSSGGKRVSPPSRRGGPQGDESDPRKPFSLTETLSKAGDAIPTEAQRDREIGLEVLRCLQNRRAVGSPDRSPDIEEASARMLKNPGPQRRDHDRLGRMEHTLSELRTL
jgi:hypothetical protein